MMAFKRELVLISVRQNKKQSRTVKSSTLLLVGAPDVNYPNTVVPIKDGFGFIIYLKNA